MGGAQRIAGFARYLPEFGWRPTVLTVKNVHYFASDAGLLEDLKDLHIERTESLDPLRLALRFFGKKESENRLPGRSAKFRRLLNVLNFFLVPDNKILWTPFAWMRAKKLLKEEEFALIMSSGPPHSTHLLAKSLSKLTRTPWVADFRDGWALGNFQGNFTRIHQRVDRIFERKTIKAADRIVAVSNGLAEELQNEGPKNQVAVITNGFEPKNFQAPAPQSKRFDLVHVGTIGNFVVVEPFLELFRDYVETRKIQPSEMQLHFIGADIEGKLDVRIAELRISDYVSMTGYLPHAKAVESCQSAAALLYIVDGNPDRSFVPGKTFEYMAAKKPVLAIAKEVEGLEILKKNGGVFHALPNEARTIFSHLDLLIANHKAGLTPDFSTTHLEQYSRKKLTEKLTVVFEQTIENMNFQKKGGM